MNAVITSRENSSGWISDVFRFIFNAINAYPLAVNVFPSRSPKLTQNMNFLYSSSYNSMIVKLENLNVTCQNHTGFQAPPLAVSLST